MAFREVWVRPLDLHETFAADGLVAASSVVEVGRVVQEANWALATFLVQKHLKRLSINEGVVGKLDFSWGKLGG
jgi:hypothetical protein